MTIIIKSFVLGGIKCYYCKHLEGDCNANIAGEIVECQMNDPRENYHGDACFVGYSGNIRIRYCNFYDTIFFTMLYSENEIKS